MLDNILNSAKVALKIADSLKNQDLKEAILGLKEEILDLREENISLKEQLSKRQNFNMVFENNRYFNVKEDNSQEGPYCSNCWDSDKMAIRLQHFNPHSKGECYVCPRCKNTTWI
jgi:hypothetical protein